MKSLEVEEEAVGVVVKEKMSAAQKKIPLVRQLGGYSVKATSTRPRQLRLKYNRY